MRSVRYTSPLISEAAARRLSETIVLRAPSLAVILGDKQ